MLSRTYFETSINQHRDLIRTGHVTVEYVLTNGQSFLQSSLFESTEDYVAFRAYPNGDGMDRSQPGVVEPVDDLIVVPYESIHHIRFTTAHVTPRDPYGFNRSV